MVIINHQKVKKATMPLNKNQLHTVTINGYTSDGEGVARIDGQVVFVKHAIDSEVCKIRILRTTKTVAWAKIESIINPSPHRITSGCPAYGPCGGCNFLHMSYDEELRHKQQRVADALERVGGLEIEVAPIIVADKIEQYRNKAIFAVGNGPTTGFYVKRSHRIVPITSCLIQAESANRAAGALREWMADYNISAYDEETRQGLIRHLFVRTAKSGDIAVCIVATAKSLPKLEKLIETIHHHCPQAVSIVLCTNTEKSNVVLQGTFRTLWGEDYLIDTLLGLQFQLSPRSFFQINQPQAERLYEQARTYANLTGNEVVLDLYCGTGTITLIMARDAKQAIGAEIVAPAVQDARENAKANDIQNTEFIIADAADATIELQNRGIHTDVIVVDPPRKGLAVDVITQMVKMSPDRIVYISCDPATLARDLKLLDAEGYKAKEVTPIDMFPRCAHVECVVLVERK